MVRCCRVPLQSNIFTNDKDVQVLSVGTHNHNAIGYTKNDLKEIKFKDEAAHKSSEYENRVHEISDNHIEHDFMHEQIYAQPYDCIDSTRNRSSSDVETVKICRYDEMNDYDKVNLHCNAFNKYIKCVKEIEPPFLSSVLKSIESKIDICSILNEKGTESIEKQKADIEQPIVKATSKKNKRTRDETSHNEECIQKLKKTKKLIAW